ncbi:MAG TPA: serine--tRNA ligase, partial [Campylobacterales bacterium]|nr:serine--tRNA ligase [Campylobacterales bacterium]
MIDIKALQNSFDEIANKLQKKKIDESLLAKLKELSLELKEKKVTLETLQAEQNTKSKLFPVYQKEGKDIASLKAELNVNKQKISLAQEVVREIEEKLTSIAMGVPNIPDDSVPEGADEEDNLELKKVLDIPTFDFEPKEHWDLDANQEWIDFERGVKLSKSRFSVLKNDGARLERALSNYMLDFNRTRG